MTRKLIMEIILCALMLLGYSYHFTGNLAHEVIGVAILAGLVVHIAQNWGRFSALFKFRTGIYCQALLVANGLLAASMLTVMVSGLLLSRGLFGFLNIAVGLETRQLHMAAAYWALIFMGIHLGLYWHRISKYLLKVRALSFIWPYVQKTGPAVLVVAIILGTKASIKQEIGSKLFLEQAYDFWDSNKSYLYYVWQNLMVVVMYATVAHYAVKWNRKK